VFGDLAGYVAGKAELLDAIAAGFACYSAWLELRDEERPVTAREYIEVQKAIHG
jgi:hypothetical protein